MKDEKILCPYCREDVPMEMAMSGTHMRCPRCHSTSPLIRDLHTAALTPEDVVRHAAMSRHREAVKDGDLISRAALLEESFEDEFGVEHLLRSSVERAPAAEVISRTDYMKALRRCEQMSYLLDEKIPELRKRVDALTYHGRWIPLRRGLFDIKGFKCSVCGHVEKSYGWVYCHCGAKMDLEVEG